MASKTKGPPADDPKGNLGLSTLSQPRESSPVVAEIIFVHGLGGGSRKTWSYSPDPSHFWPQSWLSKDSDFSDVRIHSFGYAADWANSRNSVLNISDFAHALLGNISNHPDIRRSSSGIILCGHSLGGCVAKKAYILARQDPLRAHLAARIRSIIFLGTPHRGSDLAGLLSSVLSVSLSKKPFVKGLVLHSSELEEINDAFRNYATDLRLTSFYETLPVKTFRFFGSIVVEKHSATLGYPGEEIAALVADHRTICKFKSRGDPNYKTIRNALLTAVDAIRSHEPEPDSEQDQRQQRADNTARLRRFLQIQSMPEQDFDALRVLKQPGSCEWLTRREEFTSWVAGGEGLPSVFWLSANPGSGKSVLSSHVLDTLRTSYPVICSGFSFQGARSRNSAISECLRSLAFQMAQGDAAILNKLLHLEEEGVAWNPLDELNVWRTLFVGIIFDVESISQHVWVIDGLDECVNFQAVFTNKIMLNAASKLRIFMASRPLDAIERRMRALGPNVSHHILTSDDTAEDMTQVIMSNLQELGIPEDEDDRKTFCQTILSRSSGMFLWVRLVLQELEAARWTTQDVHSALNEIPCDLTGLYAKNLGPVCQNSRTLKLARPILTWVALGSRTMTTDEIRCVVGLEVQETLQRMEVAVPNICAELLTVDKSNRIHIVHETFRAFLLSEACPPSLGIGKTKSNSRIATVLLQYLASELMRPVVRGDLTFILKGCKTGGDMALADYAARYFGDHLQGSDAADDGPLDALLHFLEGDNILSWIALAVRDGDMLRLANMATHIREYVDKRLEVLGQTAADSRYYVARQWGADLFQFSCRFGPQLANSPGSLFDLIPSLCPSDTAIARSFSRFMPSQAFRVVGTVSRRAWESNLASLKFNSMVHASTYGLNLFAVALGGGTVDSIEIYDHSSTQRKLEIPMRRIRDKYILSMKFSPEDQYLVVHWHHCLIIFDPHTGTFIHMYKIGKYLLRDLTFTTAECLVYVTRECVTHIEWKDRPGNLDITRRLPLPTDGWPKPVTGARVAADEERMVALLVSQYKTESLVLWDAMEDGVFGKDSCGDPYPPVVLASFPTRSPEFELSMQVRRYRWLRAKLCAWMSPNLALPVLARLSRETPTDCSVRIDISDYLSGAQLYEADVVVTPRGHDGYAASFSGNGRVFALLLGRELHIHFLSTARDGSTILATTQTLPMGEHLNDWPRPGQLDIQLSFDGSRLLVTSPLSIDLIALPQLGERSHCAEISTQPPRDVEEDGADGPVQYIPRTNAGTGDTCLTRDDLLREISFMSPAGLDTAVLRHRDPAADPSPGGLADLEALKEGWKLVIDDSGSRAAWEYFWTRGKSRGFAHVVADLTPPLAQWDMSKAEGSSPSPALPAFDIKVQRHTGSHCQRHLLNQTADRLLRQSGLWFELMELPSGRHLATRHLREFWDWDSHQGLADSPLIESRYLTLIPHPTEPDWLMCVDVRMPDPVVLISWLDLTLGTPLKNKRLEGAAVASTSSPSTSSSTALERRPASQQPTPPGPIAALLHGLEVLLPKLPTADDRYLWSYCLERYLSLCAALDPCLGPLLDAVRLLGFNPIAFSAAHGKCIFRAADSWILSTDLFRRFPRVDAGGRGYVPLAQRAPAAPRGGGRGRGRAVVACDSCDGFHRIGARRHFHSRFWREGEDWNCFRGEGGVTSDGRPTLDLALWAHDPADRVIVRDGLRYGEEVELMEYRDKVGRRRKLEWRRVEDLSSGVKPVVENRV